MSLDFTIIPISQIFEKSANEIKSRILTEIKTYTVVEIDTNYSSNLNSRTTKWKKLGYDIIIVDYEFLETKNIKVKFMGKNNNIENMQFDDFIDLIVSFEQNDIEPNNKTDYADKIDDINTANKINEDDIANDSNCVIM